MLKAKEGIASTLCDYTTYELATQAAAYTKLDPMKVKSLHESPRTHQNSVSRALIRMPVLLCLNLYQSVLFVGVKLSYNIFAFHEPVQNTSKLMRLGMSEHCICRDLE